MDSIMQDYVMLFLYILRMIVMIINFIGYTVIPELKNSHGLAIRCYIVTYIVIAIAYSSYFAMNTNMLNENLHIRIEYLIRSIIIHYCNISSALWLQVISFDIWWTFRNLRHVDCRVRKDRNAKFIWYALYAGGLPIVLGMPGFICHSWSQIHSDIDISTIIFYLNLPTYFEAALYVTVCLCNIFFCVAMFCTIRQQKKDTAALSEGSNHRHGVQKQWFTLYVKLFLIMGIHIIGWLFTPFMYEISTLQWIYHVSELVHSILMFRMFIWRDSVKQTLRKRFCSALSICSRKSLPGESNTISSPSPESEPETASSRVSTTF